ncbi:MAG: alpha/beta hydrolase [Flavobacteriales bacterium]|nr:alpha/beta hydrolase [Flavobacteriales bacterium]
MNRLSPLLFVMFFLFGCKPSKGNIFYRSFGSNENPAIIFLHGGPGYNSFSFEASTAQKLSDLGYFVITFDQRGCGRSMDVPNSSYDLKESFEDIDSIYLKNNISKATLIGHSWGGTLGIKYALQHKDKVDNLILVSSPVSYPEIFKTILKKCRKIYTESGSSQLNYIEILENGDTTSLDYSTYCLMHAMYCKLYKSNDQTETASNIWKALRNHPNSIYLNDSKKDPVIGFYENEQYTTMNLTSDLKQLRECINILGLYGVDDGLFDLDQFKQIEALIGKDHLFVLQKASHSVFIDQQEEFLIQVDKFLKHH